MKLLVLLFLAFSVGLFAWRFILTRDQRALSGRWGARLAYCAAVSLALLAAFFVLSTATTWRFF